MKVKKYGIKKIVLQRFLFLFVIGILLSTGTWNAEAASMKTVQKAYGSFLAKHKPVKISDRDFNNASYSRKDTSYINCIALFDLDKDKIPELITRTDVNMRWHIVRIYTYRNGKVRPYKFSNGKKAEFDNCAAANGAYNYRICKKGHFHNAWGGYFGSTEDVYVIKSRKLQPYLTKGLAQKGNIYKKNGKAISAKSFQAYTKQCTGNKIKKMASNSAATRGKLAKGKY